MKDQELYDVAVVGGGAAGCMAALAAAEEGARVLLLEANAAIGEKLKRTGNGRGNISHRPLSKEDYYYASGGECLSVLSSHDPDWLVSFFHTHGLTCTERDGYLYPRTDQAASVVDCFRAALKREGICLRCDTIVRTISLPEESCPFFVLSDKKDAAFYAKTLVLATGSGAGLPEKEEKAGAYLCAEKALDALGVIRRKARPALCPLRIDDALLTTADGVRTQARLSLYEGVLAREAEEKDSFLDASCLQTEEGELQITKKHLSGIPILQLSHRAGELLESGKKVTLVIDFLPELSAEEWQRLLLPMLETPGDTTFGELLSGILRPPLVRHLLGLQKLTPENKIYKTIQNADPEALLQDLVSNAKAYPVVVTGLGEMRDAQVVSGGVSLSDLRADLSLRRCPGLYLAGELCDIDGRCGGYNLHWAFATGHTAGTAAARRALSGEAKGGER